MADIDDIWDDEEDRAAYARKPVTMPDSTPQTMPTAVQIVGWALTDYDGSPIPDGGEPRVPVTCGTLRDLLATIAALESERDDLKAEVARLTEEITNLRGDLDVALDDPEALRRSMGPAIRQKIAQEMFYRDFPLSHWKQITPIKWEDLTPERRAGYLATVDFVFAALTPAKETP